MNYELESKVREITELVNAGKVEMAATVLSIELGLSYREGKYSRYANGGKDEPRSWE